jgi:hypothetical protein
LTWCFVLFKIEEGQESLSDVGGKCINAEIVILTLTTTAYGLTNNGIVIFLFLIFFIEVLPRI